jgi:hypothetical protein
VICREAAVHLASRQSTLRRKKKNQWPIHLSFYVNGTAKKTKDQLKNNLVEPGPRFFSYVPGEDQEEIIKKTIFCRRGIATNGKV